MIRISVEDDISTDFLRVNGDIYIDVSKRILNKVEKTPHNKWYLGYFRSHRSVFEVDNIDILDGLYILKQARDEVREELKIERHEEEHHELDKMFGVLSLEEKRRLMSNDKKCDG